MLADLLNKQKAELENIFNLYNANMEQGQTLYARKNTLETEIDTKTQQQKGLVLSKNPLLDVFYKKSKKYQTNLEQHTELSNASEILIQEIATLTETLDKLGAEIKGIDIRFISAELERLKDKKYAIKSLISKNAELVSNPQFMIDLINEDIRYIEIDKTNDKNVYTKHMSLLKQGLEKKSTAKKNFDLFIEFADQVINEIRSPKTVGVGKYKIPHAYLFEIIRNARIRDSLFSGNYGECDESKIEETVACAANSYLKLDGTLPLEYGIEMERLYSDTKKYVLTHTMNFSNGHMGQKEYEKIKADVYTNGLRSTLRNDVNALEKTTIGNYRRGVSFIDILKPDPKLIITIPRTVIDGKKAVWGADVHYVTKENPGFVLPQFVYGSIDKPSITIEHNPIPLNNRKVYPYEFADCQTYCDKENTNAN